MNDNPAEIAGSAACSQLSEYVCPECLDHRVQLIPAANSEGLVTEEWIKRLSHPLTASACEPIHIDRVICVGCGLTVPANLLPTSISIWRPKECLTTIQLPKDGDDVAQDLSEPFQCEKCANISINVKLQVMLNYPEHGSAELGGTTLSNARCAHCNHLVTEGMLPEVIEIPGEIKWRIDVQLGYVIPFLDLRTWMDVIDRVERFAQALQAKGRPEAARRLIRRASAALHVRANELRAIESGTENTRRKRIWDASLMDERAKKLDPPPCALPIDARVVAAPQRIIQHAASADMNPLCES